MAGRLWDFVATGSKCEPGSGTGDLPGPHRSGTRSSP